MDRQIRNLKKLIEKYLHQTKDKISKDWRKPLKDSDDEIWFFRKYYWFLFWDEITFIFDENEVVDIAITQYFFGMELRNIYFFEYQTPQYKVVNNY